MKAIQCVLSGKARKKPFPEVKVIKQQIESVKHDIEDAERNYDLEKLAQLKYGTLPDLEKKNVPTG